MDFLSGHCSEYRSLIACLLLPFILSFEVNAQQIADTDESSNFIAWSEGAVTLVNGTNIEGLLKLDPETEILSLKSGSSSKSYSPRMVKRFWFYDEATSQKHTFYSLSNPGLVGGTGRFYFFEVLREFSNFALLSRWKTRKILYQENSDHDTIPIDLISPLSKGIFSKSNETLYMLDDTGNLTTYLKLKNMERNGSFYYLSYETKRTRRRVVNRRALKNCTKPHFEQLRQYATEYFLSFRKKDELLKILDHYGELVKN